MFFLFPKRKGIARILILILTVFSMISCAIFILFLIASSLKINPYEKNIWLNTLIISLFVLWAVLIFLCVKYLRLLQYVDKTIFDAYFQIVDKKEPHEKRENVPIYDVIDTVVKQQEDSLNRELVSNLLRHKAELAQLQSQINPHFLYNTLDSIRGLALMENVPKIAEMLESLAQLFRNNTRKMGLLVPLSDEIMNVDNYILIQKFRFQDRFTFEKKIADDDKLMKCLIPNFIIQPILENAISHGLENKSFGGNITLSIYSTQSRIIIEVTDNGGGMSDKHLRELIFLLNSGNSNIWKNTHNGIGIINIDQRIKLQYGDEYGLSIASTLNVGTQVEITLPLQ